MKKLRKLLAMVLAVSLLSGSMSLIGLSQEPTASEDIFFDEEAEEAFFGDDLPDSSSDADALLSDGENAADLEIMTEDMLYEIGEAGELYDEAVDEVTSDWPEEGPEDGLIEEFGEESDSMPEEPAPDSSYDEAEYLAASSGGRKIILGNSKVSPGNTIRFGVWSGITTGPYYQMETNWRVLNVSDGKALLVTRIAIDNIQFYKEKDQTNVWQGSDAQKWCGELYNRWVYAANHFPAMAVEKSMIIPQGGKDA